MVKPVTAAAFSWRSSKELNGTPEISIVLLADESTSVGKSHLSVLLLKFSALKDNLRPEFFKSAAEPAKYRQAYPTGLYPIILKFNSFPPKLSYRKVVCALFSTIVLFCSFKLLPPLKIVDGFVVLPGIASPVNFKITPFTVLAIF